MKASRASSRAGSRAKQLELALEWLSRRVALWAGSSWAFGAAVALVLLWLLTGPVFEYSDTWQMVINTATTISAGT